MSGQVEVKPGESVCDRRKLISTKLFGRRIQRQLGAAWRTDEKETEQIYRGHFTPCIDCTGTQV